MNIYEHRHYHHEHDDCKIPIIIQGSNVPIVVTFDDDVSSLEKIAASLWYGKTLLKEWEDNDITVDEDTATFPLDEDETKEFQSGMVTFELKGVNQGVTVFWKKAKLKVIERHDKVIDMVD